jgi:uncharacterized protein YdeI (YjbR/CyaY-like superfamily)
MPGPRTSAIDDLPTLPFASAAAWRRWLERHHEGGAIWLKLGKKGSGIPSVTYGEALEVALCHGWIDGRKRPCDDQFWLQQFGPRTARSKWSQINRDKAERLIGDGKMAAAGLREVERAKADGRWDAAYAGQRTAEVPDDLAAALAKNPKAAAFFASLDRVNRYAILHRIHDAKRLATRRTRIDKFVAMLEAEEKIHPHTTKGER